MESRRSRGESRGEIAGTMLVLVVFLVLILGALAALGGIDQAYARAQDQSERALRALLRPQTSPRSPEDELQALDASLARLDRVPVRRELGGPEGGLALAWRDYAAKPRPEEAALDRLVLALGQVEQGLAAKRDSLSQSFYALFGAMVLGLVGALSAVTRLRFRLRLSGLEAEWRKRGLREALAAEEDLKRRLARELHDDAAQDLAAAKMLCERACAAPGSAPERAAEAAALLGEAGRKLRSLALGLRPPELEGAGLSRALESLCARVSASTEGEVCFTCAGELPRTADAAAIQAYRIVQEALANARKHAPSHRVELSLAAGRGPGGEEGIDLAVRDFPAAMPAPPPAALPVMEGAGLDPSVSSGMGLGFMRERADLAGCALDIDIGQAGSTIRLFVPAEAGEGMRP